MIKKNKEIKDMTEIEFLDFLHSVIFLDINDSVIVTFLNEYVKERMSALTNTHSK